MNDIPNGKNLNDLSNTFSEMKKKKILPESISVGFKRQ